MFATAFVLVVAYVAVWAAERTPALRFRPEAWFRRYTATDLAWFGVALAAAAVTARVLPPLLRRLRVGPVAAHFESLPGGARLVAAVALYDLVAFAVHVMIHRSNRLWNIHKVHHSSLELDGLATTRTHTMELLLRNVPAQAIVFAVGGSAALVAAVLLVYSLFALIGHSNLSLPLRGLEVAFITPRLHRLHHLPASTHQNFGTILSIWDRASGHLLRRDASPSEPTGVPGELTTHPQRFLPALRAPWRSVPDRGAPQVGVPIR